MNYLAFDTSGTHLTVAVGGQNKVVYSLLDCSCSHSVLLMPEIEKCLKEAQMGLDQIDIFACSVGPGSFTGIRIGVSTAKAFAYAKSKKVLGVTSFESLAYNILEKTNKLALIDARHDNFYVCGFDGDNKVIVEPCFKSKAEIIDLYKDFLLISDTEIDGLNAVKGDIASGFVKAVEAKLATANSDRETLVPVYVKKSQAEEEL